VAPLSFQLTEEPLPGHLGLIRLAGAVDLYAAPEFKECVNWMIGRGKTKLIVDLSRATLVDFTTLGVLVSGMKSLRIRGGTLAIVCPDTGMADIFAVTGLDRVLAVHATLEAARTELESDHSIEQT
jgi:anti-sigma B factor antagonist